VKAVFLADAPYVHTRRWIEHYVSRGVRCDVISFRPAEIPGADVHYIDGAERLGKARYLLHARRVRHLVQSLQPDVVHAMHLTSYGFLGALAGVRPLVISVWGTDVLEAPRLTPLHDRMTRYALARADLITATGLHLAGETTRYAPRGVPVTVLPYGVDLDRFSPEPRQGRGRVEGQTRDLVGSRGEDGAGARPVVIGTLARLSYEKGLPDLLAAFGVLQQRFGHDLRLRIAGDGPERAALEAQARRLGLGEAVEFRGWVEHEAVPAFLRSLDVFVLASTYEGFGVAAVEAAACALPVVATNVYGIPDVVSDGVTGLLVPPRRPRALADAIARLVEDPRLRSAMGDAGRAYVQAHFDWAANVRQAEAVYDRLLRRRDVSLPA
jgi:glycosyltransferase involved in cell wall biosynthesis